MGAALTVARHLIEEVGGRVTVFMASIPSVGPGSLIGRKGKDGAGAGNHEQNLQEPQNIMPTSDFYKRLALECTGKQIAIDLFLIGSRQMDVSGGCWDLSF